MTTLFYSPSLYTDIAGSKLTFTQTGTTTAQNTYTDEALTVPSSNPVVADASGVFAAIYLDPTLPSYRVKWTTSANVLIKQWDGVPSNQNIQQSIRLVSTNPNLFLYDTDGTVNARKYRIRAAGNAFEVQSSDDAESVFTTILQYVGGILFSGGTEVAVTAAGSFTGFLSGMTATTSGTFNWRKVNNIVYLWIVTGITGTSNSNSMSMSSASTPVGIIPASGKVCSCIVTDGSNAEMSAVCVIDSGGTFRFDIAKTNLVSNYVQNTLSGFTASGTKGLAGGWLISYPLL